MQKELSSLRTFQKMTEMSRIFRTAVAEAQEESRRLGVPNMYSINGRLHYELPNGELTTEIPEIYRSFDNVPPPGGSPSS